VLGEARQVRDHENGRALVPPEKGQDPPIRRRQRLEAAAAERGILLAQRDHPLGPPQERARVALLVFDVDRFVVVLRVDHGRQEQALRVRSREPGVAVGAPLHRRAHTVAVTEVDVVPHSDLVAVVEDRRAGQREQQRVHQLDAPAVVVEQRCQPPPNAQVDAHRQLGGVGAQHQVALLVRHHLQRELVVIAQEDRPLRRRRDLRCLLEDVENGERILHAQR